MKAIYKKHILLFSLLVFFTCLCGCKNDSPTPKHNDCEFWNEELEGSKPEFVEDYIYMWDLLENEYPLLNTAERITGKNAEDIKERYYRRINTVINPQDFFDFVINPCLQNFSYTGHLCAYDKLKYEESYSLYKNPQILKGHDYLKSNFKQMTSPEAKIFYGDIIKKDNDSKANNKDSNKKNGYILDNNLSYKYYPEKSAAYVNIKKMNTYNNFDNEEYKELKDFFTKIETEGCKNCIIDVRRNGGGSCLYWIDGIVKPNLSEDVNINRVGLIKGEICKKYLGQSDLKIGSISKLDTDKLPNLNPQDLKENLYYWSSEDKIPCAEKGNPLFTGKFWLLVSDYCYSSCETFAMFCKESKFATLVGQTTGGDGVGVDPIVFSLPNTGICLRFSSSLGLNPDGSGSEEFGTTPDIEIKDNEDALEKCLSLISKNN